MRAVPPPRKSLLVGGEVVHIENLRGQQVAGIAPGLGHCGRSLALSPLFLFKEGFIGPALLPHSSGWLGGEGTRSGPLREAWQAAGAI